MRPEWH